jgi:hypothetical protein
MSRHECRVCVFLDWQNVYHCARESFDLTRGPATAGQVDPVALGRLLVARIPHGVLTEVRIYRGRPSRRRDPRSFAAFRRQTEAWRRTGGLVSVIARDLRYLGDWPARRAEEKGIDVALAVDFVLMAARGDYDVGVLFSSDTDLVPALEAVIELRPGEMPACEAAAWAPPAGRARVLSVRHAQLRQHLLKQLDFQAVADETDYARGR